MECCELGQVISYKENEDGSSKKKNIFFFKAACQGHHEGCYRSLI